MITDTLAALLEHLRTRPAVTALAAQRIYGCELPADEAVHMPRHVVVVVPSGGAGATYTRVLPLEAMRVDVYCYGPSHAEAVRLRRAVRAALRNITRLSVADVLLHWVTPAGGLAHNRDGQAGWPFVWESYTVLAAEHAVAA